MKLSLYHSYRWCALFAILIGTVALAMYALRQSASILGDGIRSRDASIRGYDAPNLHSWVRIYDLHKPNNDTYECVPLKALIGNPTICIHPVDKDEIVSKNIKNLGLFEPEDCKMVQRVLQQNPGMNLLDLGANLGEFSFLAATMGRTVVAVEPMLENVRRLHRSVQLNGFQDNITLVMNGLSDLHMVVKFTRITNNIGATRVKEKDPRGFVEAEYGISQTRSVTLDDLLPLCHSQILFVKMDIEGSEVKAIRSGKKFFLQNDVRYVLMEPDHHPNNPEFHELVGFFLSYGLEPHTVGMRKICASPFTTWTENILWIKNTAYNSTY